LSSAFNLHDIDRFLTDNDRWFRLELANFTKLFKNWLFKSILHVMKSKRTNYESPLAEELSVRLEENFLGSTDGEVPTSTVVEYEDDF